MHGRASFLWRALTLAFLVMLAAACAARADTLTVTGTGEDAGPCAAGACPSIRSALTQAAALPAADIIVVPAGEYRLGSALTVGSDVTLRGDSARTTTIYGGSTYRVFEVAPGVTATISHVSVSAAARRVASPKAACQSSTRSESTLTSAMRVCPPTRLNMQCPRTRPLSRNTKPENVLPGQESM